MLERGIEDREKKLLDAVRTGDEQSFSELYHHYYKQLYHYLANMHRRQEGAVREILQEAFLRVWLNRDRLHEISNFRAWVYKVVSTESLTYLKKELHAKTKVERFCAERKPDWEKVDPINCLEVQNIRYIVEEAIRTMPERRKQIYKLSRENGYSPAEIAHILGVSVHTVHNTLSVALRHIRQRLIHAGYGALLGVFFMLKLF